MHEETGLSKNRLEALTDGIFAITMTLLVLDISVPQISSHPAADVLAGTELLTRLINLWPKTFSFGISFIILAIYWMAHHRQFHYIKHSDRILIWINVMFLMATCLLPFSTSLLGEYREQQISILVYGGNSIAIASLLYVQWWYATSHRSRLVDENLDPIVKSTSSRRLLFGIIVYLIAIVISFVYIQLSIFLFALILVPAFLPNKMMHQITFGRFT
jgi:uncharacterized membrane protein